MPIYNKNKTKPYKIQPVRLWNRDKCADLIEIESFENQCQILLALIWMETCTLLLLAHLALNSTTALSSSNRPDLSAAADNIDLA